MCKKATGRRWLEPLETKGMLSWCLVRLAQLSPSMGLKVLACLSQGQAVERSACFTKGMGFLGSGQMEDNTLHILG